MNDGKVGRNIVTIMISFLLIVLPILVYSPVRADPDLFTLKWTTTTGLDGYIGPVTKDINGDGIDEIFMAGLKNPAGPQGRIVCLNGLTGSIIWAKDFKVGYVDWHVPLAIGDLNHDGNYELVQTADTRTIARYASNGTEFWNVSVPSGWHQFIIADTDENGYPYVYVTYHDDSAPYTAKVSKLYGRNGTVAKQADTFYSCYGGISCADINNDGEYEILVSDRSSGKGMRCYDEDLNLLWYMNEITCSSHCIIPVDITGDSNLELVAMKQTGWGDENGGIYVLNSNGIKIPGKYSTNLGLGCHVQPAVYDIDKDGNLELITCYGTHPKVWDLGRWALDATLSDMACSEPPDFANVMGDSDLEIIACSGTAIRIYDSAYTQIQTISTYAYCSVVQDIDNDGLNEMLLLRNNTILVYDTLAEAPTPRVRTDTPYYSERRANAGVYVEPIGGSSEENTVPYIPSNPSPADGATGIPITSDLTWTGGDPDPGDTVTYDIYFEAGDSTPDVLVSDDQSGTSYDPGTLQYSTHYYWQIIAKDNHGLSTSGPIWDYTTQAEPNNPPTTPSNPTPANGATNQAITIDLSWTGGDPDPGDTVTYDIYLEANDPTPDILVSDDQTPTTYDPGTLQYSTHYYWQIISKDNHGLTTNGPIWDFQTQPLKDQIPPQISNINMITSTPMDTDISFGWENISCTVTDDSGIDCVHLVITDPYNVSSNSSMTQRPGSHIYYYNTTYTQHGNYSYSIWAEDTKNNSIRSSSYIFSLAPNWDINNDGRCTVLDQILISNHYSESGSPGWIREDVDNNGKIQVLDFIFISNHYGESWWV